MGVEEACQMAEKIPEIEYYIIFPGTTPNTYQFTYSNGMKTMLNVNPR